MVSLLNTALFLEMKQYSHQNRIIPNVNNTNRAICAQYLFYMEAIWMHYMM